MKKSPKQLLRTLIGFLLIIIAFTQLEGQTYEEYKKQEAKKYKEYVEAETKAFEEYMREEQEGIEKLRKEIEEFWGSGQ